jgi:membrane protein YqaA with SNARE-associated domain
MAATDRLDPSHSPRWMRGVALAWGFAEATLFFVVPDVWITWVALHGLRQGMVAVTWTLAGALAGGVAVYLAAHANQMVVLALLERVPAIGDMLVMRAYGHLEQHGWTGPLLGGFSGVPYKLYAAMAEGAGLGLPVFLSATAVARGLRFAAFALLAWLVARWCRPRIGMAWTRRLWLGAWVTGYALYWMHVPE